MVDGLYQSVICFFMAYLLFRIGTFVTGNGLSVDERERFGAYIGIAAIICINLYILINTYRWDWLMVLLVIISILLVWFWTGIYSSFKSADFFYKTAAEVFGQATFWAVLFLSVSIAMLPRFAIKFTQKNLFPYDVDIVREQERLGKFDHLLGPEKQKPLSKDSSLLSSPETTNQRKHTYMQSLDEDQRPIYPPSVAPTAATHHRSNNGSDGTDYRNSTDVPRISLERQATHPGRPSLDRARPSFDRMRASMDRTRPSFEASNDFTSAALLTRLESSQSLGRTRSNNTNRLSGIKDAGEPSSKPSSPLASPQ